jgi:putative glutamine amidotransferase
MCDAPTRRRVTRLAPFSTPSYTLTLVPRPAIVAVTASTEPVHGAPHVSLGDAYVRALAGAGLVPLVVPPLDDPAAADRVLDAVAGLVLTGGEDVDPRHYGAPPHPALGDTNDRRDRTELALVGGARRRRLPTLAICRGAQLLNVALGGTLVQDVPSDWPGALPHESPAARDRRVHAVALAPDSCLARAVGADRVTTNSYHHQALDRVADALRVTGRSEDGVAEGVDGTEEGWWVLGVQWHPEELVGTPEPWDRNLFAAFAEQCRHTARGTRQAEGPLD